MRIVFITLLPLVLYAGAALAQSAPTPQKPAPAGKSSPAPTAKAKEARADSIAECMRLWDTATHMSKQEWSRTCQRIQSRLENLKVENLGTMSKGDAKKKRGS